MLTLKRSRLGWKELVERAPTHAEILIVDDEAPVRESLKKLVSGFGYGVKTAGSAEEADHWINSTHFDLLLLDIDLPRMKGVEFLQWALQKDPELAVIMMTGLDDPALAEECISAGARTYLVKPPEQKFLRMALRDALALRSVLVERNDLRQQL